MIRPSEHRPTAVIVSNQAIRHNLSQVTHQLQSDQQIYAVVKANAYGHGAVVIARIVQEEGVDGLAVATVDEAIELRQHDIDLPILVLGLSDPRGIAEVLLYDITIVVSNLDYFNQAYQQLVQTKQTHLLTEYNLSIHLAIDTGMGRIGLQTEQEIRTFVDGIRDYEWVDWQGVFTHFSTASEGPQAYIETQWQRWQKWLSLIPETVTCRHFANSAMSFHPQWGHASDIVRLGICLYGLDPSDTYPTKNHLMPALSLVSEIMYVKQIQAGMSVSYGATYTASEPEWIATIPIGYADGWLRHYQSIPVLIQGQACPIVGVINMDQIMVKLPYYIPTGTTVTLIGQDGSMNNAASKIARHVGTIGYEVLTSLSSRIPRIYLEEEESC